MIKKGNDTYLYSGDTGSYQVLDDGDFRLKGDATAWKDMIMDIFGKRLNTNTGKVDYDYTDQCIKFQNGGSISNANDRIGGNLEINHEMHVGSSITFKPHIHWFQEVDTNVSQVATLTMEWRLQKNGQAKNTTWSAVTCTTGAGGPDIFEFSGQTDGYYNQLSRFPDIVVDCSVSDTFQIRMARTDSNSDDGMFVYFFDLHGLVDSFGSDEEIAKE